MDIVHRDKGCDMVSKSRAGESALSGRGVGAAAPETGMDDHSHTAWTKTQTDLCSRRFFIILLDSSKIFTHQGKRRRNQV